MSPLNPNAASYFPISKKEGSIDRNFSELSLGISKNMANDNYNHSSSLHNAAADKPTLFNSPSSAAASGCNINDKDTKMKGKKETMSSEMKDQLDEEIELDFLKMQFPDISETFIAEVYFLHGGDLICSMDMLYELKLAHVPESSETGRAEGSSSSRKSSGASPMNHRIDHK